MTHNVPTHFIVTGLAAVLVVSASLAGCRRPEAAAAAMGATPPVPVTVAPVEMTDLAAVIEAGGVVQARTTATLTSRVMAPVRDIRVAPGDHVRKGETLLVLAGDELIAGARAARSAARAAEQGALAAAAELDAAEAGLALALASHQRIVSLQAKGSATAQELDDATAALRGAEARVSGASARVRQARSAVESAQATSAQASTTQSFATIVAPFTGVITENLVELGNMASPGTPLLRLEDTGGFRLEARVDESRVAAIRRGDRVPVLLGTDSSSMAGTVTEVSGAVDADAHAFLVKIALPDAPGLRSGAFGKARFAGPTRRALTIPSSSIVRRGQLTSVFVVEQNIAHVRLVDVRDSEVLAGLVESEIVIVAPPVGLTDGRRVSTGGL
jgi:multidrug efflux pump subunit AcrA (membrane-fusion protein)